MFIYFGSNTFNQLNDVKVENTISLFPEIKCFSKLIASYHPTIDDVFIGWSYLLFKAGDKIYHTGFSESNKEPGLKHISDFDDIDINTLTCGLKRSFLLTKKGNCYSFSTKEFRLTSIELGEYTGNIKSIDTEDSITVALTTGGKVLALHNEEKLSFHLLPMPLPVKEVSSGKEHVLFLTNCGKVYSYGFGSKGQLGHGMIENVKEPAVIEALEGIEIKSISCGGWHSAAISTEGDLYMWGWNESGQLGLPCNQLRADNSPIEKEFETVCCLPRVIDLEGEIPRIVRCGSRHTAVITENNQLWTWGWNGYGQLGHKKSLLSDKPEKVDLPKDLVPSSLKCKFWSTLVK
ncbi:hypothetical protein JTE90_011404 [Oedothorax gibbosus]|uniref:RCC1 domain-containing protein 1 n=1 Tax=Oedothorax gibbosus TaxID=931172 RepID=A0AAV6U5Z7_9ARAC|nr:hypothetical protein JTE90_011404 [Oedothorax gibbosus]